MMGHMPVFLRHLNCFIKKLAMLHPPPEPHPGMRLPKLFNTDLARARPVNAIYNCHTAPLFLGWPCSQFQKQLAVFPNPNLIQKCQANGQIKGCTVLCSGLSHHLHRKH